MKKSLCFLFMVSTTILAEGATTFIGITDRDLTADRATALTARV